MTAWSDDRLAAAFEARAAGARTPTGLTDATLRAVAAPSARWPWRPAVVPIGIAALALIAVGGGVAMFGGGPADPGGLSLEPTASAVVPTASALEPTPSDPAPTATASGPDTRFGLPVIDVPAAIDVRDGGFDDRELAVQGWFSPDLAQYDCMTPSEPRPLLDLQTGCPGVDHLVTVAGARSEVPSIAIVLPPDLEAALGVIPTPVVLYGHFDDRRAVDCAPTVEPPCRDVFLVDAVEVDGALLDQQAIVIVDDGQVLEPAVWTADDAIDMALGSLSDGGALLRVVQVEPARIGEFEQGLVGRALAAPWWWHVTVLDSATSRARTFAMTDPLGPERSQEVYELLPDGGMTTFSLPY